jgi:hypothetical protein
MIHDIKLLKSSNEIDALLLLPWLMINAKKIRDKYLIPIVFQIDENLTRPSGTLS